MVSPYIEFAYYASISFLSIICHLRMQGVGPVRFPFGLSLGVSRRTYFVGTVLLVIGLSRETDAVGRQPYGGVRRTTPFAPSAP